MVPLRRPNPANRGWFLITGNWTQLSWSDDISALRVICRAEQAWRRYRQQRTRCNVKYTMIKFSSPDIFPVVGGAA